MRKRNPGHTEMRKTEILMAAQACFARKGLGHTTMRDIASASGLSLSNIYRYFESKEALIHAFVEKSNLETGAAFNLLDNASDFRLFLKTLVKELVKELAVKEEMSLYVDILSEAFRSEAVSELLKKDEAVKQLAQSLGRAANAGKISLPLSPSITALSLMAFIENAAIKCIFDKRFSQQMAVRQARELTDLLVEEVP